MRKPLKRLAIIAVDFYLELRYRNDFHKNTLTSGPESGLVVCMTSYPARIKHAWIALESLFRQQDRDFHLVLVLAEAQFPGRVIPRMLRRMVDKGLEILWVEHDGGSFDHLWPAYEKYPSCAVISVDDDKFFSSNLVAEIRNASNETPGTVIGWRGWRMMLAEGKLEFSKAWVRADESTPSRELFMPPGNGSLYPPGALPDETGDHQKRQTLCPNADDVWYWAMANRAGTPSLCLGKANHRPVWKQQKTPSLASLDPGPLEFDAVIKHFGLVGELENVLRPGR